MKRKLLFWIENLKIRKMEKEKYDSLKATERQVGGDHYKNMKIQPTEFIHKNNIPFIPGNVIKYVCRYKFKNGLQDLEKAKHYIDLLIEFEKEEENNQ